MSPTGREMSLLLVLVLVASSNAHTVSAGAHRAAAKDAWVPHFMELNEDEAALHSPVFEDADLTATEPCIMVADCMVNCTLPDLKKVNFKSADYTCPRPGQWTVTVNTTAEEAVIRMHLEESSQLAAGELLTVLEEDGSTLATLNGSKNVAWVATSSPFLILEYEQGIVDNSSQIQITLVAYNQTQDNYEITTDMSGTLEATEQTNWTGPSSDYAVNTERLWHLNLMDIASHINFTVSRLDLEAEAGDILIIGAGDGPYDSEPVSHLLTGKFSTRRYHVPAGEAFVYFLSRSHAAPRTPFKITYTAEGIVGTTTMAPTTTDRDHPPTPSDVDFQLDCYITGIDPSRFVNTSDTVKDDLQSTLAIWANVYRTEHGVPAWRPVHADDIQFSAWMLCDYTSGWVINDPNCVRVTWFIELLRTDGQWAFLEPQLRGIVQENGADINADLGFQFSLTLNQVNEKWWWAVTIALVPLSLLVFIVILWMSTRTNKVRGVYDEDGSVPDLDKISDEHETDIDREVVTIMEKDQLQKVFPGEDTFQVYDPELQGPNQRYHGQYKRPLKSALKAPKKTPATYTNPAFEGDDGTDADAASPKQALITPAPAPAPTPTPAPVSAPAPAPAPVAAALPAEPASSELTEQLRLLNELNKTLKEEEQQAGGIELPRVERIVKPAAATEPKKFIMNEDGTGTEADVIRPGDNVLQLEDGGGGNRKSSHV